MELRHCAAGGRGVWFEAFGHACLFAAFGRAAGSALWLVVGKKKR